MRSNLSLQASTRAWSAAAVLCGKPLPPRIQISEDDIEERFLKGSGPGGQKINKTSSAVQLKHLPTGMVVKFQGTRSREQNRKTARKMLSERLEEMELGDESRTAIKRAEASKKKASKTKKSRRKYRALDEAKKAAAEAGEEHDGAEKKQDDVRDDAKGNDTGKS
ncbi:peptidyl-tRNA hydrolase domain-containing protein [Phyllosticta capitalensis]|uniref:RF-1 domain-containing protein n=1 Tax=Phyllosticta capitalensis TaxID=121624 RepID=UPI003131164C